MDLVYDKYFDQIYSWALKKTNNKEDAEDLTNNIFLAIFEYFNKNITVQKLDNLIWKIAHNIWYLKAKNYIKEKDNVTLDEVNTSYNEKYLDKVIYNDIINNLTNIDLTEREFLSFELYYCNDLSIKEISIKLKTSESNIKYYLYSARKKVKERYDE